MVHPLLDASLHLHLHEPVHVVGRGLVVGRARHEVVDFFLRILLRRVEALRLHPGEELVVVNDVFFKGIARFVGIVHMHLRVVRVHLAAALVDRHEHGFDAARRLRHEASGARGGYGEAGNVAPAVAAHVLVEFGVGLLDAENEGVVLLSLCIVDCKRTAFACHHHAGSVGRDGQRLLHFHGHFRGLFRAVAQSQGGNHVALGRDAHARAASLRCLVLDFLPKAEFRLFHLVVLRVALDFLDDGIDFLLLQVDDVVHEALGEGHVFAELVEVEESLGREGVFHVGVEVDGQEAAAVVGAEGNFTAGVGRYRGEAQVGVAVGNAFAADGVPEEHAGLGAFPGIVYDFLPERLGVRFLLHDGLVAVDGELLVVGKALRGAAHELVVDFNAHVGPRDFSLLHLGIDEVLGLGVTDADGEHQCAAAAVLGHFAGRVAVAFHEGHDAGGGQGRVFHGRTFRTDAREVVSHTAAALHELHLLLVELEDGTVGVAVAVDADHEAVGERSNLEVVADARHGRTGRHDVAEVVEHFKDALFADRVGILAFDARQFVRQAPVHVGGRTLVDMSEGVLHGIFVHPDACSQLVAGEVFERGLESLFVSVGFLFHGGVLL